MPLSCDRVSPTAISAVISVLRFWTSPFTGVSPSNGTILMTTSPALNASPNVPALTKMDLGQME